MDKYISKTNENFIDFLFKKYEIRLKLFEFKIEVLFNNLDKMGDENCNLIYNFFYNIHTKNMITCTDSEIVKENVITYTIYELLYISKKYECNLYYINTPSYLAFYIDFFVNNFFTKNFLYQ